MKRPVNLVIVVGDRQVRCDNGDDRSLLVQAKAIAEDPRRARGCSIARLTQIKDACQRYSLGKLQRLVKQAMDQAAGS
jgi:hypothetical protein